MSTTPATLFDRARRFFTEDLWRLDQQATSFQARGARLLQLCVMIVEGFLRDQLLLRASALTYIASLTLIPLLVVVVSILKGVGVGDDVVMWAVNTVTAASPDAAQTILRVVEEAKLGTLGSVGAGLTVVTTVLALRHAEETLNDIWGLRRGRTWLRRLADYLLVIVVVPMVVSVAFSLEATLQSAAVLSTLLEVPGFEFLYQTGLRYLPFVLFVLGFSFIYWFLPNTEVRPLSALLGGVVAASLVLVTQRYLLGMISGAAKYNALFGSFAAIPLILFWLYIAIALVLLGAEISYAHQNLARYRREVRGGQPAPAEREALGVRVAAEVARSFRDELPPTTAEGLAETLGISVRHVRDVLEQLERAGLVAPLAGDEREVGYNLGRPAERITLTEVLVALRGTRDHEMGPSPTGPAVDRTLDELERQVVAVADERSLADVIAGVPDPG
ncbi:MAG: YhjD/YihY/BrkB family envelope integrity protein [Myxococcota bacterium]